MGRLTAGRLAEGAGVAVCAAELGGREKVRVRVERFRRNRSWLRVSSCGSQTPTTRASCGTA